MNEGPSSDDLRLDEVAETLNGSAAFVARLIERGVLAQTVYDATTSPTQAPVATATTDAAGHYLVGSLPATAAGYTVEVRDPSGVLANRRWNGQASQTASTSITGTLNGSGFWQAALTSLH